MTSFPRPTAATSGPRRIPRAPASPGSIRSPGVSMPPPAMPPMDPSMAAPVVRPTRVVMPRPMLPDPGRRKMKMVPVGMIRIWGQDPSKQLEFFDATNHGAHPCREHGSHRSHATARTPGKTLPILKHPSPQPAGTCQFGNVHGQAESMATEMMRPSHVPVPVETPITDLVETGRQENWACSIQSQCEQAIHERRPLVYGTVAHPSERPI